MIDGKLTFVCRMRCALALENNSNIRIQETQVEGRSFPAWRLQPFDPLLQSVANVNRYSYSGYTQLQGVGNTSNAPSIS